ncbi:type II toxin-antitoxin system HigB family toxin [Candidatus Kaiserbacteria bacterium]|nr:type II toxin-antitoxin system HigB family toxin [Candidatus Kaiserbacteria bacterium]
MHVISLKMLRDFWRKHPEAEQPLRNWHTVAEHSRFTDLADLKRSFGTADYVPPYTVFDVGGNNFRVVVIVRYRGGKMFVRWVMTHREVSATSLL